MPAASFPNDAYVTIRAGEPLSEISTSLSTNGIITSAGLFSAYVRVAGRASALKAGVYRFTRPLGIAGVAERLTHGAFGIAAVRITFPEGYTVRDMSALIARELPEADAPSFIAAAKGDEGYLFPDTYEFLPSASAADIVEAMRANFDARIASITPAIAASGHALPDIVTMASLIEKEARTPADRRMVAGILWNRVRLGMPLQVDAVFGYIEGTATHAPSLAELSSDSPYNTYLHAGLPPGPICNPGLDALLAALTPAKTADLYYLTGKDGKMHYARTYAEHERNQLLYL
ncbi:MAG: endolytic transglycosylase MltG [Patescibacteria group bacterium]|nr:endolytic transglycosylase MltG [Patescibacteria group bacterium]